MQYASNIDDDSMSLPFNAVREMKSCGRGQTCMSIVACQPLEAVKMWE